MEKIDLAKGILDSIGVITNEHRAQKLANTYADYDRDEEGNMLSCCGDILDPDNMICKTCKEHC